jgi:hypothetical protein
MNRLNKGKAIEASRRSCLEWIIRSMEELPWRGIDGSLKLMKQLQVVDQFVEDVAPLALPRTKQKRRQRARTEKSLLLLSVHFSGCWKEGPNSKYASAFRNQIVHV